MQINKDKKDHTLFLKERSDLLLEAFFHCFWDALEEGTTLTTPDQEYVRILSPGRWNHGKDPDFISAKILFQGKELQGDVVLHEKASDYVTKGLLAQSGFDNVILHVFVKDDLADPPFPDRKDGALSHIIHCRIPREILESPPARGKRCCFFPCMSQEKVREFFTEAGHERLQQKSLTILEEMITSGVETAFLKSLLLAAGSKYNKDSFALLFARISEYDQATIHSHYKALLWGESSLLADPAAPDLPEENRREARDLWDEFWSIRKTSREKLPWKTGRIRPFNSPERRIAMVCAFLDRYTISPLEYFAEKLRKLGAEKFIREMKKELTLSHPFWDLHCNFHTGTMKKKASILGAAQAQALLTDALIPSLLAYGKLNNDITLERSAVTLTEYLDARRNLPFFGKAVKQWFPERAKEMEKMFDNACLVQGVLYMTERFCSSCEKGICYCPPAEL